MLNTVKQFKSCRDDIENTILSPDNNSIYKSNKFIRDYAANKWDELQQYYFNNENRDIQPMRLVALYHGWATMVCDNGSIIQGWAGMFTYFHGDN